MGPFLAALALWTRGTWMLYPIGVGDSATRETLRAGLWGALSRLPACCAPVATGSRVFSSRNVLGLRGSWVTGAWVHPGSELQQSPALTVSPLRSTFSSALLLHFPACHQASAEA